MTSVAWEPLSKTRSLKEHDETKLLNSMMTVLAKVETRLCAEWPEVSGKPAVAAKVAVLMAQNELVVPLIDEINEMRRLTYGGLAGQLVRRIKEAEGLAVHTCRDTLHGPVTCGACLIAAISAEVWIPPTLGTA